LQAAALAFGSDQAADLPAASLAETEELRQTLQTSANHLKRRTQQLEVANDRLQERSTELSEAQHIAKIGNWTWDASTGVFFASDELQRLYGRKILLPFDAQKGQIFPDEAWQKLKAAAKATRQNKMGFKLLLPTLPENGAPIWTRINGEPVCNASGEVTGLRGTLQDVETYVQTEIALKDSAKRYRTLFDGSPEAILVHVDKIVVLANLAAVSLFKAGAEADLVGQSMGQLIHPDFLPEMAARGMAIAELGQTAPPFELKFVPLQGDSFSAQIRCVGMNLDGRRFIQTYIHDLTEENLHKADMEHLRTEMHDMLVWQVAQHTVAALAHEVNQPLASVSILCEVASRMLQTDGLSKEDAAEQALQFERMLKNIAAETARAGTVLRNLVHSVAQPDITQAPTQVDKLVAESVQVAMDEGVFDYPITVDCAADLPAVQVNHLQVVKVLLNLIHNGAQAMHGAQIAHGKLDVSTALTADGSEVCVSVRDVGPGISADLQAEVFQPFITTKSHGLGMGLTISRALIEANGGKLWHTPNDGPGATFHFTLPVSG
jgi:PAS domain S-box-containing protein